MTSYSTWQRKLALVFKSEKTLDAPSVIAAFADKTIADMKSTIITSAMCRDSALTDKPRIKNLLDHLDNLQHEFIGQSELCYYHAVLIVLVRRQYKVEELFAEFEQLWESHTEYLLNHLSLRWLVSACDTFVDHSSNTARAAILMNVITMVNTLKIYETQQYLQTPLAPSTVALENTVSLNSLIDDKVDSLYETHLSLYDGLTYFHIGTDDTLKNMRHRYQQFHEKDKLATTMLLFAFDRLQNTKSAFATMKALHKDDKSKWWLD